MNDQNKEIQNVLRRMETRIVRGFEGLGISVADTAGWITANHEKKHLYINSKGKSLVGLQIAMRELGCPAGVYYEIHSAGQVLGTFMSE